MLNCELIIYGVIALYFRLGIDELLKLGEELAKLYLLRKRQGCRCRADRATHTVPLPLTNSIKHRKTFSTVQGVHTSQLKKRNYWY